MRFVDEIFISALGKLSKLSQDVGTLSLKNAVASHALSQSSTKM